MVIALCGADAVRSGGAVKVGSLCQGIGGADLALETHGHTIAWGCEQGARHE